MKKYSHLSHLLFIYLFLIFGYSFTRGFFSLTGIGLIFFSFIYLFYFLFKKKQILKEATTTSYVDLLKFTLLVSALLALYLDKPIYTNSSFPIIAIELLYLFSVILIFSLFFKSRYKNHLFISLVFIALILRVITIFSSPKPYIDVFEILTRGSQELLKGKNPYQINYQELYPGIPSNVFGYLPGIFIFTVPAQLLFHDVRFAMIFAQLITVFLLLKLISNRTIRQLLVLIFLFNPLSCFIIEQSWVEPIINMLIISFVYLILKGKSYKAALILGLFLASKQFNYITLLPLTRLLGSFNKKLAIVGLSVFLLILTPFFLWSKSDFIYDTVKYQYQFYLQMASSTFTRNMHSGLSLNSLYYMFTGKDVSFYLTIIILLIVYLWLYFSKTKNPYWFTLSISFWLLSFFLFNRTAFLNHYYQISFLILLSQTVFLKINKI